MRIRKIHIRNFKSLVDFELESPKPFCAFVGPNASGKSNIFEALEFLNYTVRFSTEAPSFFGGRDSVLSYLRRNDLAHFSDLYISIATIFEDDIVLGFWGVFPEYSSNVPSFSIIASSYDAPSNQQMNIFDINDSTKRKEFIKEWSLGSGRIYEDDFERFADGFSRVFIGNANLKRTPALNSKLSPDASNLPQIIGKIFESDLKRNDFIEWLRILIPEFENIEIKKSNIDASYDFLVKEKTSDKPFSRNLISDGTYNILSLMAAVYQSDQPQFLCIEEPENGLHPEAIELLVDFFREKVEAEGHHIWINTHSPTLVRCMNIDEVVLINKINGETKAKKMDNLVNIDIKTDEAWLSNALGGGVSWSK